MNPLTEESHPCDNEDIMCDHPVAPVEQRPNNFQWTRLDAFSKFLAERDDIRLREEKKAVQSRIREELDKQVADINHRKQLDRIENIEFYRNISAEADRFRESEKQSEEKRKMAAWQEKQDRELQQRDAEERRRQHELKQNQEDAAIVARIENDLKQDQRILIEKKAAERAILKKLMLENEAERQTRMDHRKRQEAEELQQLQQYHDLLEKQERNRRDDLSKRVERQKALIRRMEEKVIKTIQEKSNDDNVRAEKQQAEMDARAIEISRFKAQRLAQARLDLVSSLKNQIEEREARRKEEDELRRLHATVLKSDLEEYILSEEEKVRNRKVQMHAYKRDLDRQLDSQRKSEQSSKDEMSPEEMQMNRELIRLVDSILPLTQS